MVEVAKVGELTFGEVAVEMAGGIGEEQVHDPAFAARLIGELLHAPVPKDNYV